VSNFRFHILGMPHTTTSEDYCHCAYTSKVVKGIRMFSAHGHECIDYSNEGSTVKCEHVQIFTEAERAEFFGPHDKQKLYHLLWDPMQPYWQRFNDRCVEALRPRVKKGDFILTLSGNCQVWPIGNHFPGSYSGTQVGPALVEWGIGYYGTMSRYRIYESHSHREWCMGKANHTWEENDTAVVPNFFDLDEFPARPTLTEKAKATIAKGPYYLFIGRVIPEKGFGIAVHVTQDIGARLVIAGQGDPGDLPKHVEFFGHADVVDRAALMTNAIAVLNPTRFREPFGGTAVEAQLCGAPAITSDHGAFCETTLPRWRCANHREFVAAALAAQKLTRPQRKAIRRRAQSLYSLEAVAPLYERYFQRLMDYWGAGYYEMNPVRQEDIADAIAV
jgi:glycosyltransferase involved in cell wall biosynthesis